MRGSAAVADDDQLIAEVAVGDQQRMAQGLAPAIAAALQEAGWRPSDLQIVAITVGPGSFTGLRVGLATAKTLAYVTHASLLAVDTLAVIANQAPRSTDDPLRVVMDAQRRQLYAATFQPDSLAGLRVIEPVAIVDESQWLETLPSGARVTGPGLARMQSRLRPDVLVVDKSRWEPTSASVAQWAWKRYQAGQRDDLWSVLPRYYRPSAAEEKAGVNQAPPWSDSPHREL